MNSFIAGVFIFIVGGVALWYLFTSRSRQRMAILNQPFPENWEAILKTKVAFSHTLNDSEKQRFRNQIQIFIAEKRITGLQTSVDDTTRILVAVSAVIPMFGYQNWDFDNLAEVLIVEGSVDRSTDKNGKTTGFTLGQVTVMQNTNVMVLSKSALHQGFYNIKDKLNVGIHEFAHIIDHADGIMDGIPQLYMPAHLVARWNELMDSEISKIASGDSAIRDYGATNEAEFFAVSTEFFFEQPALLQAKHPEVYDILSQSFKQNTSKRFSKIVRRVMRPHGKRIGRNSPCPCGSGEKFKRCCLK
jgi:hypothetical protein